jgi:hypothetical protein
MEDSHQVVTTLYEIRSVVLANQLKILRYG